MNRKHAYQLPAFGTSLKGDNGRVWGFRKRQSCW